MKFAKQFSAEEFVAALSKLGYEISNRQENHIRLTVTIEDASKEIKHIHHLTIPDDDPIRPVTLSAVLGEMTSHHRKSKETIAQLLFG